MRKEMLQRLEEIAQALALADPGEAVPKDWDSKLIEIESRARDVGEGIDEAVAACRHRLLELYELEAQGGDHDLESFAAALSTLQDTLQGMDREANPVAALDLFGDDVEMVREFIAEGSEQLGESDAHLLNIDKDPEDEAALAAVFRCVHTIKGLAGFLNLSEVESLAHAAEDLLDQARKGVRRLEGPTIDVVFEAVDALKGLITELETALEREVAPPAEHAHVTQLIERIRGLAGAPLTHEPSAPPVAPPSGGDDPMEGGGGPPSAQGNTAGETIRIDADRLDRLVDMIGELVITESMVKRASGARSAAGEAGREMSRHMTRMDKITRELQELAGSLRMVPVRATFQKMARLARDVARKSGKRVDFQTFGEDSELDKSVVDRVGDPLVHLVRNAIDHGLEPDAATRLAAGKPEVGRVELRASHRAGSVYVEVEDDGRGLDRDKLLRKAEERGLVTGDENLSDRDVFRLICAPGFSTAERISSISGRGVGMDVVKRQIDAMGGSLEISSQLGRGTCVSMKLPLTLAVIDGLVVRLGLERYIIPTLAVTRLVTPTDEAFNTIMRSGETLMVENELVPVLRLDRVFDVPRDPTNGPIAVIAESDGRRVAIYVDELIGQQQAVIKSLGGGLGNIPGVSGCAIMPDGKVGLVLDVGGLIRLHATRPAPSREPVATLFKVDGAACVADASEGKEHDDG